MNSYCLIALGMGPAEVVFLNREDGSVDFNRGWADYKAGFGDMGGEFWLGLDKLHTITYNTNLSLHVNIEDWSGNWYWAEYSQFSVGPESDGYCLYLSGYNESSTTGDSMGSLDGMMFTTYDADNDVESAYNCADAFPGGMWYKDCSPAHPTGNYVAGGVIDPDGITWHHVFNSNYAFKTLRFHVVIRDLCNP